MNGSKINFRNSIVSISLMAFSFVLSAQETTIDSLKSEIKNAKHDSIIIKSSISLGEIIFLNESDKALKLWENSVKLCQKELHSNLKLTNSERTVYLKYLAGALNNIGYISDYHGNSLKALSFYRKSLKILEDIEDKDGIATSSNNIGFIYKKQGDYSKALEYYHISLKIREEIKDKIGIANSLNNIGFIYDNQEDISKAFEYYNRSLKIQEEIKDKKGIAGSLTNIGSIYKKQNNIPKCLEYYFKSLKIREEINDKKGIANSLNNIGGIYIKKGDFDKGLEYFQGSLKIREEIKDKQGVSNSLNSIAAAMLEKGLIRESLVFALKSLKLAQELGFPEQIRSSASTLTRIYKKQRQFGKALEMYELEIQMRDSIDHIENKKASVSKQFQYQYEKKVAADSVVNMQKSKVKNARLEAQNAQLKNEKTQRFALYGGLILVLVFSAFLHNRFKISQRQKIIIEQQKDEVDEQRELADSRRIHVEKQQKEIIDSITYAKRLQKVILPHRHEILENIPQSFVIYQPKDIVAGDFYWAEKLNDFYYLAVADCTGHGVPGALVSMVCSNALNRTLNEFGITETGEILDNVRKLVLNTFIKSGDDIQDGMDISLCRINKLTKEMQWSGANNPLWYFNTKGFHEVKADKQPIGKYDYSKPFTTHNLTIESETNFYFFTDGFSDQFNVDNKKMTKKRFRELIISVQGMNMVEQKQYIENYFDTWKGNTDQIDDVCIIGITI